MVTRSAVGTPALNKQLVRYRTLHNRIYLLSRRDRALVVRARWPKHARLLPANLGLEATASKNYSLAGDISQKARPWEALRVTPMRQGDRHRFNQNPTFKKNFVGQFCQCPDQLPIRGPVCDYQRNIGIAIRPGLAARASHTESLGPAAHRPELGRGMHVRRVPSVDPRISWLLVWPQRYAQAILAGGCDSRATLTRA